MKSPTVKAKLVKKKKHRKKINFQLRHFDHNVNLFFKVMSSKALDNILVLIPFAGLYQLLKGFSFGADDNLLKVTVCGSIRYVNSLRKTLHLE